ncbi:MAG: hypothetical protein AAB295_07825, partial [Chloroflexota bacterium]
MTAAVPADARVLRSVAGVTVVLEVDDRADARAEGERLRQDVAERTGDEQLSAGVSGPKSGVPGAHFALVPAEPAVV